MSTGSKLILLRADLVGVASMIPAETRAVVSHGDQKVYGFRDIRQTLQSIGPELNLQYELIRSGGRDLYVPQFVIIREFAVAIPATPADIDTWMASAYKSSKSEKVSKMLSEVEASFSDEPKAVRSKVANFVRLLRKETHKLPSGE